MRLIVVREYLKGISVREIKSRYQVSHSFIYDSLKHYKKNPRGGKIRKITWPQRREIAKHYRAGKTTHELATLYAVSVPSICYILSKLNVRIRRSAFCKIHTLNESVLDRGRSAIDVLSEEALYWIGFLAADGSIQDNPPGQTTISLHLGKGDLYHLIKFRQFFRSTHKIQRKRVSYRVQFRSDRIAKILINYGIKSGALSRDISGSRHFWRGFVDGDGCISIIKKRSRVSFNLIATPLIMEQFVRFVRRSIFLGTDHVYKIRHCEKMRQFCASSRLAAQIINLLYHDCSMSLRRKQILADKIIRYYSLRRPFGDDAHVLSDS
jgi:transposase